MIGRARGSLPCAMLSDDLKARTRDQHHAAEASPAMQAVLADDLTRASYRDHLARLVAFYGPAESALAAVPGLADVLDDLDGRLVKTAWLRDDLGVLGTGPAAPDAEPPTLDVSEALGMLYVIEGSTLGGKLIARHLERTLGVTSRSGAQFYSSYGPDRGPRWTHFKRALDTFGTSHPDQSDRAIQAAADTFDALRAQMAAPLAPVAE